MPGPSEIMRRTAKTKLLAILGTAPCFCELRTSVTAEEYVDELEIALFDLHRLNADTYRSRLLELLANIPNILPTFSPKDSPPEKLAVSTVEELLSIKEKIAHKKEMRKRQREATLHPEDSVMCPTCRCPIRALINPNRFDIDDEAFGTQYDSTFGSYCECEALVDEEEATKKIGNAYAERVGGDGANHPNKRNRRNQQRSGDAGSGDSDSDSRNDDTMGNDDTKIVEGTQRKGVSFVGLSSLDTAQ